MISFIQLIADMMHVLSYVVLIRQIKVNKSVHGKEKKAKILERNLLQDPRNLPRGLPDPLWGPVIQQEESVSDVHEVTIYWDYGLYHLPDQIQKTILPCKHLGTPLESNFLTFFCILRFGIS